MEKFSVGLVLSDGLRLLPRLTLRFLPVVLLAMLPLVIGETTGDPEWNFLYLVVEIPAAAILTHAASQALRAERVELPASLAHGLRRTPAAIGMMLLIYLVTLALWFLVGIGMFAGLVGMFVFGILGVVLLVMLFSRWFVAMPALVVEKTGAMDSLARSGELTAGRRWRLAAVILLLHFATFGVLIGVTIAFGRETEDGFVLEESGWGTALFLVIWTVYFVLRAVLATAAHHHLRREHEAATPEELARVFG
jgi:hypothetical protein